MNVRPGDLAMIVGASDEHGAPHVGKVVQVLAPSAYYPKCWETGPLLHSCINGCRIAWLDAHLRPIRDPGDDACDESAAWLPPVPSPAKEPA